MTRWSVIGPCAALIAALWWYHTVAADYRLFGGTLAFALDVAASILTAILCVIVAEALVGTAIIAARTTRPTGFERAGISLLAGFSASLLVLAHFGVNVTTMLATSALLTAILGLALQPTLGALIAGFTLSADRVLKIGDAVLQGGEAVSVTAIGWRSIIGTRGDGTRTVISNSRILDGTAEIVPEGASVRGETFLLAPLADEPETIVALVKNVVADLPLVDIRQPIEVGPASLEPERAQARYRIVYWARSHEDKPAITSQIATRLWYTFQREDIDWPVPFNYASGHQERRPTLSAQPWKGRLADGLVRLAKDFEISPELTPEAAAEAGTLLLYSDRERIEMPDRVDGCVCVLLHGELEEIAYAFDDAVDASRAAAASPSRAAHRAELQALSARLARKIGPFADFAVHRAAVPDADLDTIAATVAMEIEDEHERRSFMPRPALTRRGSYDPGFVFDMQRGATNALQSFPLLRAKGPVGVVAIPRALLGA